MIFFVGCHHLKIAEHFNHAFISISALENRRSHFQVGIGGDGEWILDSAAFTRISRDGRWIEDPSVYAAQVERLSYNSRGRLLTAVTQDMMCEEFILKLTGLTIKEHQRITIERTKRIQMGTRICIMPVLQGYEPHEYVDHLRQYGKWIRYNEWVGVGSVCKRNTKPEQIYEILHAIKTERPDIRLHGFGLKKTAFTDPRVVEILYSADSMAWSLAARMEKLKGRGYGQNDWRSAKAFEEEIHEMINPRR